MAWVTPKTTWVTNNLVTASDLNDIGGNLAYLKQMDLGVHVYHNTTQSIASAAWTQLSFNSERYDPTGSDEMHDPASNNVLTTPIAGTYLIWVNVQWAGNTTGKRGIQIRQGTTTLAECQVAPPDGVAFGQVLCTEYAFGSNNLVKVMVYQNSGAALNINFSANSSPEFGMRWVGA